MRILVIAILVLMSLGVGRAAAAEAEADALATSITALEDEDPLLRLSALKLIGGEGNAARTAVPSVLALLKRETDRRVRAQAGKTLAQIGTPALKALTEALEDPRPDVRFVAAEALAQFGPESAAAIPGLTQLLADDSLQIRAAAAYALGEIGPAAREALPALADALDDPAPVRPAALRALTLIGPDAVPVLSAGLRSRKASVRSGCAFALGVIGPEAQEAVPALAEVVVQDAELSVRGTAVAALGEIGPAAGKAVPALARCLKDPKRSIQYHAIQALVAIGPAELPPVTDLLKDTNPSVRASAIFVLGQWGAGASGAVPALMEMLADREITNRSLAALSLGQIGPDARAAAGRLRDIRWSSTTHPGTRLAVTLALARIQPGDLDAEKRVREEIDVQKKTLMTGLGLVAAQNYQMEMNQMRQSLRLWAEAEKASWRQLRGENRWGLKEKLQAPQPEQRLLALQAIALRREFIPHDVIPCLSDANPLVRHAARLTLVRLARGNDFGPRPTANRSERAAAIERWRRWSSRQDADPRHADLPVTVVEAPNGAARDAGP